MPELSNDFIQQLAEKLKAIGSLKAVGDTWVSFDSSVPPGGVPFCGQTVSRALYADLLTWATAQGKMKSEEEWQAYAAANGGNCPYYSEGDSLTTFRMPCVLGYLRGSGVTTEGGTYKPQKLPNVIGTIGTVVDADTNNRGKEATPPFYPIGPGERASNSSDSAQDTKVGMDLSLYNPDLYEDGADVQPETFHVLVGVYAVGVITNINNTDVSQLQTGLATLEANTVKSVNNITPVSGNVEVPMPTNIWGLPTNDFQSPGSSFTAEKNGFFCAFRDGSSSGSISINGVVWVRPNDYGHGYIPFKKGDKITTSGLNSQRYFYTE